MTRIAVCITTHPSRRAHAERLADELHGLHPFIIQDPEPDSEPSSLRVTLAAWRHLHATAMTSHVLVLQDDAVPCRDFTNGVAEIIGDQPDAFVALYIGFQSATGQRIRRRLAAYRSEPFRAAGLVPIHPLDDYIPCVALLAPARHTGGVVQYLTQATGHDDQRIRAYCQSTGTLALASAPCLCDHDNTIPSLVGGDGVPSYPREAAWFPEWIKQ